MTPTYSVVIPVFNQCDSLRLVLRCLEAQSFPRDRFECIVVDDGSTDGTAEMLKAYKPRIDLRFSSNRVNFGRTVTRNVGWQQSCADTIIFLDADSLPAPDWLARHDEMWKKAQFDVISGMRHHIHIAPDQNCMSNLLQLLVNVHADDLFIKDVPAQFQEIHRHAALGVYPEAESLDRQLPDICRVYPKNIICAYSFITANVAVRRTLLEQTAGFDPFTRRPDDTELGIRLWEAGARFGFADAKSYHLFARQLDRNIDVLEYLAFFYRHPYHTVLTMYLWGFYCLPRSPKHVLQDPDSLTKIAKTGGCVLDNIEDELAKMLKTNISLNCRYSKDEMIEYYRSISKIDPLEVAEYLDCAIDRGLCTQKKEDGHYFNVYHTSNWIRKRSPYQQHLWLTNSYARIHRTPLMTKQSGDLSVLRYAGRYTISATLNGLENYGSTIKMNIPLPIVHYCQPNVRITRSCPEDLVDYVNKTQDMILLYPLRQNGSDEIRIEYDFECCVQEFALQKSAKQELNTMDRDTFLHPTYPPQYIRKAEGILKRIPIHSVSDPYSKAYVIYQWILENITFQETPLPDFYIVITGFGPCVHISRLFMNLCRMVNIPAREQCGAFFTRPTDRSDLQTIETTSRGYSPFTHTWAEFYTSTHGWVPVEFMSLGYGKRQLTPINVIDDALRDEIIEDTETFNQYYFGCVDPYRIYSSNKANKTPMYVTAEAQISMRDMERMLWRTYHTLSGTFYAID